MLVHVSIVIQPSSSHRQLKYLRYFVRAIQVDEAMFSATQTPAALAYLTNEINNILTAFNINWATVMWQNLTMPLYSALAARLYMTYQAQRAVIPRAIDLQAQYWMNNYRPSGDPNKFINDANQLLESEWRNSALNNIRCSRVNECVLTFK